MQVQQGIPLKTLIYTCVSKKVVGSLFANIKCGIEQKLNRIY